MEHYIRYERINRVSQLKIKRETRKLKMMYLSSVLQPNLRALLFLFVSYIIMKLEKGNNFFKIDFCFIVTLIKKDNKTITLQNETF